MTSVLKIPLPAVHERVEYEVYQGGRVARKGEFIGRSFTQLGKNRLSNMLGDPGNFAMSDYKLTTYRVYCDPSWFSSAATIVSQDRNAGTITAETQEFQSAGTYYQIWGWCDDDATPTNANSAYHFISTDLTIGAGQTIKFFVEYQFSGLGSEIDWGGYNGVPTRAQDSGHYPSVVGDIVCGAVLFNYQGDAPYFNQSIGSLEFLTENCKGSTNYPDEPSDEKMSATLDPASDMSVSNNYVLISGIQWTVSGAGVGLWWLRVLTSHATFPYVFHEWSVSGEMEASGPFAVEPADEVTCQTDVEFTFG